MLHELGFTRLVNGEGYGEHVYRGYFHDLDITVELLKEDFMDDKIKWNTGKDDRDSILLVAGACIADLFHPDLLIRYYTAIKEENYLFELRTL